MLKDDGGPAFPSAADTQEGHQMKDYGMSLRDWFAGQALAGMSIPASAEDPYGFSGGVAKKAYRLADAMLAAREARDDTE